MDLTKRLGFSKDLIKTATSVLEGKKIVHPNQKAISAAAPPEDEITAADFKALKAKKKHRVEGFDRNRKRYESPLFETYEEAFNFFNKIRKSAPLTNLEIVEIEENVVIQKEYVSEAKELNTANANDARAHDCAKHVVHEQWGVGETIPTMHAEPDANDDIAWYDVMFEHGIEHKVSTSDLEIILSETHVHKKSKRMDEQEQHGKKKSTKKSDTQVDFNPEYSKEEVEQVDEYRRTSRPFSYGGSQSKTADMYGYTRKGSKKVVDKKYPAPVGTLKLPDSQKQDTKEEYDLDEMDKSMAYATGTKRAMQMTGDKPPLEKSTIKKAHSIAKAMLRKEEIEEVDEAIKPYVSFSGPGQGKTPSATVMGPNEKPHKVFTKAEHGHDYKQKALDYFKKNFKNMKEDVDILDEGRKAGIVGSVLSSPAARDHFKKLTGKEPSYFHITKNPEHAQAAIDHATKARAPAGEAPESHEDDSDTEANKHPISQLRSIADRGSGTFMGKQITRAHATKLISMHDDLKPSQKLDFVSNIGKHLSKVMS